MASWTVSLHIPVVHFKGTFSLPSPVSFHISLVNSPSIVQMTREMVRFVWQGRPSQRRDLDPSDRDHDMTYLPAFIHTRLLPISFSSHHSRLRYSSCSPSTRLNSQPSAKRSSLLILVSVSVLLFSGTDSSAPPAFLLLSD